MKNQSNSRVARLTQFSLALLASFATLLGHMSLAAAESAETTKQKVPLVASPVYFSDATWCYANNWSRPDISSLTANAPCPSGTKAYPSTLWTASITNPNPRFEARNVRARVILVDANGSEIMNKVWTVSTRLAPGATAWVAPAFESICCDYLNVVQATDGRGVAVSGSVTVLDHEWSTSKKGRRQVSKISTMFTSTTCRSVGFGGTSSPYCSSLQLSGFVPNAGARYDGFSTFVFFADNGSPVGGFRAYEGAVRTMPQGGSSFEGSFKLPSTFVKKFGSVYFFFAQ